MRHAIMLAVMLLAAGCSLFERETEEEEHNTVRLQGMVAGQPVDVLMQHDGTSHALQAYSSPAMEAGAMAGLGLADLMGLGGLAGVAGLIGAKRRKGDGNGQSNG